MRIFLMAAVAACVAGSAWAEQGSKQDQSSRIAFEVSRTVDAAFDEALLALRGAGADAAALAEVEAAMVTARGQVRAELAGLRLDTLDETQEEALDARLEAAMAVVEDAVERAAATIEADAATY